MKPERIRKAGLVLAVGLMTAAASAQPTSEQPPADPTPQQQTPETPVVSDTEALEAMGYMMAQQLRLNIGFSEEELTTIMKGMHKAATDEPQPENLRQILPRAQQIYMERMSEWQRKDAERREAEATTNKAAADAFVAKLQNEPGLQKTDSGLYYIVVDAGNPEIKAEGRDRVKVNYTGKLVDDTVFDQSPEGEPVTFGVGQVVPGFSEGIQLVGEGGKIRLFIPSELGYGMNPPPGSKIGPGSMLQFDVEVVDVVKPPKASEPAFMGSKRPNTPPPTNIPPPPPPSMRPPGPPPSAPPAGRPPTPPPSATPPQAPAAE